MFAFRLLTFCWPMNKEIKYSRSVSQTRDKYKNETNVPWPQSVNPRKKTIHSESMRRRIERNKYFQ